MQSFIVFALFVSVATAASLGSVQPGIPQDLLQSLAEESNVNAAAPGDLARSKKAAYGGGSSYSAPPCPKSYLFSCQPSVAPVPCSPSKGYAGAYSVPVPTYALPNAPQSIPTELLRQYYY